MIRALVTDLNGSFAAMEQHYNPEYRGKPVAVCPVLADTGVVVASSREAKVFGVKCGVHVEEARKMCKDLITIQATPGLYSSYQKRMWQLMNDILPIYDDPSIDEFRFRLVGDDRRPARAREIALEMKRVLREEFSPCITMSAGIAPNFFLAKVATEMQKHDGLAIITQDDLPHALHVFPSLTNLVGINWRMRIRLNAAGIFTVAELTAASKLKLQEVWGTVVGERWYHRLRGEDVPEVVTRPGSLGHSNVLSRELRNRAGVKAIALRLLGKATARLRSRELWACAISVSVSGRESWERHQRIPETQDDRDLIPLVCEWLDGADYSWPLKVSINFYDFCGREAFTPSLFAHDPEWGRPEPIQPPHAPSLFGGAMDHTNDEYGKHKIFVARIEPVRKSATEKIAFQKKELFREGRDDFIPSWDRKPHLSPAEALLKAVQNGEALEELAVFLPSVRLSSVSGDDPRIWEPVEERSFLLIADRVRETLGDREYRLHRGELRGIVARLLGAVGYRPTEAPLAVDAVFRAVDAEPIPTDFTDGEFVDDEETLVPDRAMARGRARIEFERRMRERAKPKRAEPNSQPRHTGFGVRY